MGQTLSEPVTAKETTSISNRYLSVGASCMQGWRISMEDAHTHILDLSKTDPTASFFAVYDGHGGTKVADYAGKHLHDIIMSQSAFENGEIEEAMRRGFLQLDQDMLNDPEITDELAGNLILFSFSFFFFYVFCFLSLIVNHFLISMTQIDEIIR